MISYTTLKRTTLSLFLLLGVSTELSASTPPYTTSSLSGIRAPTAPTAKAPSLSTVNSPLTPDPASSPADVNPQSMAITFARQAGAIAGTEQACGQDVSEFTARVNEAISKLASNPTDKAAAILVYQKVAQDCQLAEQKTQKIPCTKALQDFSRLPIMQSNYETAVIQQLSASGSPNANTP